jgi:low affinity Fe/Cu permease
MPRSNHLRKGNGLASGSVFSRFAKRVAAGAGHPVSFALSILLIGVWGLSGPLFGFSDTWQLVINTGTTIVTFLMVFLIQNSQNRDSQAVQLKLDELLRAVVGAHTALIELEELTDKDLAKFKRTYLALAKEGRKRLRAGQDDTGTPDIKRP